MKHYLIALLFLFFGFIQLNDPDFLLWTSIYLSITVIAIFFTRGIRMPKVIILLLIILSIGLITYIPDIVEWVKNGMPNIAAEMKTSSPFIELVREFFGLLICILVLAYYYRISLKTSK